MDNVGKGMAAGFVATAFLAALMLVKSGLNIVPQFDAIQAQIQLINMYFGAAQLVALGWLAHFIIGTFIWGALFGAVNHSLPGRTELGKGLWFSLIPWVLSMVVMMPMLGAQVFALDLGLTVMTLSLVFHLFYGAVLGWAYARLNHISPVLPVPLVTRRY